MLGHTLAIEIKNSSARSRSRVGRKQLSTTHSNYGIENVKLKTVKRLENQGHELGDMQIQRSDTVELNEHDGKGPRLGQSRAVVDSEIIVTPSQSGLRR